MPEFEGSRLDIYKKKTADDGIEHTTTLSARV
jgi:hypothetical protein